MMRAKWAMAILVAAGVLGGTPAEAAKCTIWTLPISFGTYDVFNTAPLDSVSGMAFDCSGGARNVSIAISRGQSSTYFPRTLKKGAESLAYNLFLDPARTTIWGNGSGATETYFNRNPPNDWVIVPIYGRITAGQDISAGSYADTVTVTVNF
jgi:spore coat protein U-like protein